jgi:isoleucyl-tRNA synthetase
MTLARDLARLGHSVRAHNKLPLRQPLAEATVVLVDANERAAVNALRELLARELNVKNVVVTAVDVDVCDVQVRVDFARLGPRLGGSVQELATTLATLDGAAVVKQLQSEGVFTVQLENQTVVLAREDVRVRTQPRPGYGLAAENGRALALNLEREGALEREGLAREVVHAVQNRRRECGFAVSDRVRVHLRGDEPLLAAAREHRQLLMNETLAVEFAVGEVNGVDVAVGVSGHCNGYAWHLDVQPAI